MNNIVKQLLTFFVVTSILTILLYSLSINIVIAIATSIVIQFALYNGYMYIVDSITFTRIKKIEAEKLNELTKQVVAVTCPCPDKNKELINLRFDKENYHTCNKCQKKIKTYVDVGTVLATEPILQTDTQSIEIKK